MKKFTLVIAVVLVMIALFSVINVFGEMPLRVVINGERLFFPDAQPFIDENGRTQTPARFIGEELGATVTWDGTAQKATFVKNSKKLILYIGKKEYELDGKKLQMDTAAIIKEDRTYVPARYVAEAFGATVRWDSVIKTVYIDTNGSVAPTPQGTKDPITGWIKVDTEGEYSEYLQIITFASDTDILVARYNEAEKMFIEKYGDSDVVKNIFNYVRTKKTRNNSIEKRFYLNNKAVDVLGSDISVQIIVWKEGVQ